MQQLLYIKVRKSRFLSPKGSIRAENTAEAKEEGTPGNNSQVSSNNDEQVSITSNTGTWPLIKSKDIEKLLEGTFTMGKLTARNLPINDNKKPSKRKSDNSQPTDGKKTKNQKDKSPILMISVPLAN